MSEKKFNICIDLSCYEDFDENNPDDILRVLNDNIETTRDAIDFSINDDRGEVSEESEVFNLIEYHQGRIYASWSFDWWVYSGCKDQCYEGEETGHTEIKIDSDKMYLKSHVYPEKLYPNEEL